jgi:hypothetical protein
MFFVLFVILLCNNSLYSAFMAPSNRLYWNVCP